LPRASVRVHLPHVRIRLRAARTSRRRAVLPVLRRHRAHARAVGDGSRSLAGRGDDTGARDRPLRHVWRSSRPGRVRRGLTPVRSKRPGDAPRKRVYKVVFQNEGKVYEVYARSVASSSILGFVEVEGLLFGERGVLVDPTEERLRTEFEDVERTYIPVH